MNWPPRRIGVCSAALVGLLAGCTLEIGKPTFQPPEPDSIAPAVGSITDTIPATITGKSFLAMPRSTPSQGGSTLDTRFSAQLKNASTTVDLDDVTWVDEQHLTATIPAGKLTAGTYDLSVTSPDGLSGTATAAYRAIGAGPALTAVQPASMVNDASLTIEVTGLNLAANAVVALSPASGGAAVTLTDDATATETATSHKSIVPAGLAPGTYDVQVSSGGLPPVSLSAAFRVVAPAQLAVTLVLAPARISVGQSFSVTATVKNTGGSAAQDTAVAALSPEGTAAATLTGPVPASASIAAGEQQDFVFTGQATAAGSIRFSATASATNEISLRAVAPGSSTSDWLTVQAPATLVATLAASSPTVNVGNTVTLSLNVQNTGDADATAVVPAPITPTGTGAVSLVSGPTPASATIQSGVTITYSWVYTATALGSVTFATTAQGKDGNSQLPVATAAVSTTVTVGLPSGLSISPFQIPGTGAISRGQIFSVTMTVSNAGSAAVDGVMPGALIKHATGGADFTVLTAPAPADIGAMSSTTFTWSLKESGAAAGQLSFTDDASGTDSSTGATLAAAAATTNVINVQEPAQLVIPANGFTIPTVISNTQAFVAALTVQNTGDAAADAVLPSPNPPSLSGTATATTSDVAVKTRINGHSSYTFQWTFTATGAGTLTLSTSVQGTDLDSGAALNVASTPSNAATVVAPSTLIVSSFSLSPAQISRGQAFTATMTVRNNGGTVAQAVAPDAPTVNLGGAANATTASVPAAQDIPSGGGTVNFTWTYQETGTSSGTLSLTAGAAGTDELTGAPVIASAVTTAQLAVQKPAALQIDSFTVPTPISQAQAFDALLVVRNLGEATATGVQPSPNPPTVQILSGSPNALPVSSPSAHDIPGGQTQAFQWSYQEDGTAPGSLSLSVGAAGTDANSGAALTAAAENAGVVVQAPAALQITAFTIPASMSSNQTFVATLTVQNTGDAAANAVLPVPNPPAQSGTATATTTDVAVATRINGHASYSFQWTYTAGNTGTLTLSTGLQGTDAASGAQLVVASTPSNQATVLAPSALMVSSFAVAPLQISRGQSFAATMKVMNNGGATALGVVPDVPTVNAAGAANATTSSSPGAQDIPSGGTRTFSWTYQEGGTGAGTVSLTAGASGTDGVTGQPISASPLTTAQVSVQQPAQLQIDSFTVDAVRSQGQVLTAVMVVRNPGDATAVAVQPVPNPPPVSVKSGSAAASALGTPAAQDILGGQAQTFTWTYQENGTGPGTLAITATAAGTDLNSGLPVSSAPATTNTCTVQSPAALVVTSFTMPAALSRGQNFVVTLIVSNSGQAKATGVAPTPNPPTVNATGGANAATAAASPQDIAGGGTATFTFSETEDGGGSGAGTLSFTAGASGTDVNSGATVNAAAQTTNAGLAAAVNDPPALSITQLTLPSDLSGGQAFTAVVKVTNSGGTTAKGVAPVPNPMTLATTGNANATAAAAPAQDIAPGGTATFSYSYNETAGGHGTLQLSGIASGTDPNTGLTVSAAPATSNATTVWKPAALTSSIAVPSAVVAGNLFTVTMTVNNTGEASALAVTLSALTPAITGTVTPVIKASPGPQPIAGGANAVFTWTYATAATDNGTLKLTGSASGTDQYSGAAVASTASQSSAVTIVAAGSPGLTASIITAPRVVRLGDTFIVEMTVKNVTAGALGNVSPSALSPSGPGQATLASGPTPASIASLAANSTGTFDWTWKATGYGWITFTGSAFSTAPANASIDATSPLIDIPAPWCPTGTLAANAGGAKAMTCAGVAPTLGGTATGGNPTTYAYEWKGGAAGDLSSTTIANPTAKPRIASTTYTLTVTDGDGCEASDTSTVTVTDAPTIPVCAGSVAGEPLCSGISEDRRCANANFAFSRTAPSCPGTGCKDLWDFGDGTTNATAGPNKSYTAAGTYSVTYTTTDKNNCTATARLPVFVGANAGVFPIGRIALTAAPATAPADGASTITFTSQTPLHDCNAAAPGAATAMRFTVMTDRGTITTPDVDPATPGVQVNVTGGAALSFTVRADKVGGPVHVRAKAILQNGAQASGWGTSTFTASKSLPEVTSFFPAGATATDPARLGASFDKAMNAATIIAANMTLTEVGTGTCAAPAGAPVPGTVSWLAATQSALFVPSSGLSVDTRAYVAHLTQSMQDANANPLDGNFNQLADVTPADDFTWCFGKTVDAVAPTLSCTSALPAALSPDGDGASDTTTMTVSVSDDLLLAGWRVEVRDETRLGLVRTLTKLQAANGVDTLVWDGRNSQGQVVADGNYVLTAMAWDAAGNLSQPCSLGVSVSSVFNYQEMTPP